MVAYVLFWIVPQSVLMMPVQPGTDIKVQETSSGYVVSDQRGPILTYRHTTNSIDGRYARSNYVHPLVGLQGEVLTEDFPADHLHHRGVFWAWHQLIVGGQKAGDPWLTTAFETHVRRVGIIDRDDRSRVILRSNVIWRSPLIRDEEKQSVDLVNETTWITVHAGTESHRAIDFEISLLRATDQSVLIGGSDDEKGYGGFSVRMPLPEDIRFFARDGEIQPQRTAVDAGPWVDFRGTFSQQADGPSGIAVMAHPDNPGFPHSWILRSAASMQNPAFPGRQPWQLSADEPLVLRYRIVIHDDSAQASEIDQWFDDYSDTPSCQSTKK